MFSLGYIFDWECHTFLIAGPLLNHLGYLRDLQYITLLAITIRLEELIDCVNTCLTYV